MTPHRPSEHEAPGAIERLEAILDADIAQARAVEPLVENAAAVPARLRARIRRALPLLVLAALGAGLVASGLYERIDIEHLAAQHERLLAWTHAHPWTARASLVGAIAVIMATGLPGSSALVLMSGLVFGALQGLALSVLGDIIGAVVLFSAGRHSFRDPAARPPALAERIRAGFRRNPVSFAFFIRLQPAFPFGAASVALAWLGCSFPLFLVSSTLGVIPSSFVLTLLGSGLADTLAAREPIRVSLLAEPKFAVPLVALALLALLPVLLRWRADRLAARRPAD